MSKGKKMAISLCLTAALTVCSAGTVFAERMHAPSTSNATQVQLETDVKHYPSDEQLKAKCEAKKKARQAKLEKMAKERGISVEQLKTEMKAKMEAKLEAKAKERGITVEQLKAEIKAKKKARRAELEAEAQKRGISLEQLKDELKAEKKAHS